MNNKINILHLEDSTTTSCHSSMLLAGIQEKGMNNEK
jgi:hypothetical protein